MGKNTWIALFAVVSTLGACAQNDIRPAVGISPTIAPESTTMAEASVTMPPSGYLDYCLRNPAECPSAGRDATQPEPLTPLRWAELDRANTIVNESVRYVTDANLYNRNEYWTYPNGQGDCEDYVLAKRKLLLDRGWRAETLLIGVALDLEGLRHAVLIASTDKGDFVLDNQLEQVVAWQETGYTWEKRQTASNPNIWVALTGGTAAPEPFEAPVVNLATAAPSLQTTADAQSALNVLATAGSLTVGVDHPTPTALSNTIPTPRFRPSLHQDIAAGSNNTLTDAYSAEPLEVAMGDGAAT